MKTTFEEFRIFFAEAIDDDSMLQLEPNSDFKAQNSWDSFSGMSIIAMIDDKFGITIRAEEMTRINTLEELYELISNKIK
jgi:acyl carrier protein